MSYKGATNTKLANTEPLMLGEISMLGDSQGPVSLLLQCLSQLINT